jgi:hypothetical protein
MQDKISELMITALKSKNEVSVIKFETTDGIAMIPSPVFASSIFVIVEQK